MSDKLNNASKNLQEQFARAAAAREQMQQQNGSEMVKNDRPQMKPTPPANVRQEPDRQAYNDRLNKEAVEAKKRNEVIKARNERQEQLKLENEREKDNDDRGR